MKINKKLQDLLGTDPDITIISYLVNCINNGIHPNLFSKPECLQRINEALVRPEINDLLRDCILASDMCIVLGEHAQGLLHTDHQSTNQ